MPGEPSDELFAALEREKGMVTACLAALKDFLRANQSWAFTHEEFGRIFTYFSDSATSVSMTADMIGEELGRCYCGAIAAAVKSISSPLLAMEAVKSLARTCQDKDRRDEVLRALAFPPCNCGVTQLAFACEYLDGPSKGTAAMEYCQKFADEAKAVKAEADAEAAARRDAETEAEFAAMDAEALSAAAAAGAPPQWIAFWKELGEAEPGEGPMETDSRFVGGQPFSLDKLGEAGPLAKVPMVGTLFKPKWATRHAVIKDGLLYYFAGGNARGCISLVGASIVEGVRAREGQFGFVLRSLCGRRPGREGPSDWILGGKSQAEAQNIMATIQQFI